MKKLILPLILIGVLMSSCVKDIFKSKPEGTWWRDNVNSRLYKSYDLLQDKENNYYMCGKTTDNEACIFKADLSFSKIWRKVYKEYDNIRSISETSDGNIIAAGMVKDGVQDIGPIVLLKIDKSSGDVLWSKEFLYKFRSKAYKVIETPDKGFLMCGYYSDTITNSYWLYSFGLVIKTDQDGNEIWNNTYYRDQFPKYEGFCFWDIEQLDNNQYALVGSGDHSKPDYFSGHLMIMDNSGNIINEVIDKNFCSYDEVIVSSDNNLVVTGIDGYDKYGNQGLVKYNASDLSQIFASSAPDLPLINPWYLGLVETSDKGFIATTMGQKASKFDKDGKFIKTVTHAHGFLIVATHDGYYINAAGSNVVKMDKDMNYEDRRP